MGKYGGLITGIVGTAIGGPLGAGVTLLGGLLWNKQPNNTQYQGYLSNYQTLLNQNSSYGSFIPEFGGTMQTAGNIIDCRYVNGVASGIEQFATSQSSGGGGTLGGKQSTNTTTFVYYLSAAFLWGKSIDGTPLYVDKLMIEDANGLTVIYDRAGASARARGYNLTVQNDAHGNPCGEVGVDIFTGAQGLHNWYGTPTQPPDSYREGWHGAGNVEACRPYAYTVLYRRQLRNGFTALWAIVRSATNDKATLVQARLADALIPASRVDASQIMGTIDGCAITAQEGAQQFVDNICTMSMASMAPVDGLLVARSRANPLIHSVLERFMGGHDITGGDDAGSLPDLLKVNPVDERTLPSEIQISFQDTNLRYNMNTAKARREQARHVNIVQVSLGAIAGTLTDMTRLAQLLLDEAWMAFNTYETTLLPACVRVAPGDVIDIPDLTGATPQAVQFLVSDQEISPDGLLICKGPRWDGGVYGQYVAPDQSVLPPAEVTLYDPPTTIVYDGPPFNDTMAAGPGVLVAATTDGDWDGAVFASAGFGNVALPLRAVMGTTLTGYTYTDDDTVRFNYGVTVRVRLAYGAVASAASEDVVRLAQANLMLLGNETVGWTLLQFVTATQINATDFDITGLLPGRRGTDNVLSFSSGMKVLLLSDETGVSDGAPVWIPAPNRLIGSTVGYEVAPEGAASSDPAAQTIAFKGNSVKPISPVYVRSDRSVSGHTYLHWNPRSRYDMGNSIYMQRASDPDLYTLTLSNGSFAFTVGVTTNFYDLTDAQATAWWGSVPGAIQGSVLQKNAIVGNGWGRTFGGL